MSEMRILIVEDNEKDLRSFRNSVKVYKDKKQQTIDTVECKTLKDALKKLDNSFDGAIIDLKLADEGNEGNKVVEKIIESFFRIPIVIFTGDRSNWDENLREKTTLIDIFTKGAIGYDKILDLFWEIYDTGLTRIMGGRGFIEQQLREVFHKNLLLQINTWVSYGQTHKDTDPERTEKALLRHALNHLYQILEDNERYFPEEVYLHPPMSDKITTGSIVKVGNQSFIVLSPACDLVIREDGEYKTDWILLVEIESENDVVNAELDGITRKRSKENRLRDVFNNNYKDYHHWLPKTDFFEGGIINFRKLTTFCKGDFDKDFEKPTIQISPFFIKDIVSRFSSYYARQGQPDIDNKDFIDLYTS